MRVFCICIYFGQRGEDEKWLAFGGRFLQMRDEKKMHKRITPGFYSQMPPTSSKWQVARNKWQVARNKWQAASSKWQETSGKQQVASGK
jgi:hypothetical protein